LASSATTFQPVSANQIFSTTASTAVSSSGA
jgi:hypothetical protein